MKNASFDSLKLYTRDVYAEITSIVHRRGWESFVFDQITDFHFGRYLEILAHCAAVAKTRFCEVHQSDSSSSMLMITILHISS